MTGSDRALAYAKKVVGGKVPAGRYVRLACERFLRDLKRKDWQYKFDAARADRAVRFMEKMPHVKGRWAASKQRLVLEPWACFIECNLFGWVHKKTGFRRFRKSYEEIPRKNGKSTRLAARGVYMFAADGEAGGEVYSGATSEKQAHEVFGPAWRMVKALPALRDRFGIEQLGNPKNPGTMFVREDMSKFEPLIGKPGDGASPSFAIIDEYHEHDSDHMVEAMETGMGAREQPLLSEITTAGTNLGGPCYETRRDIIRILEQQVDDETIFGIIFGIDETDRWDDPKSLMKANPNYGISVFPEYLLAQLDQAKRSAAKQNAFRTKHLNEWVGSKVAWMNMLAWQRQKRAIALEDYAGCRCWIALDLASKVDVAAMIVLIEFEGAFYIVPRFWVPEAQLEENEQYKKFHAAGALITTPGEVIDFEFIENEIREMAAIGLDIVDIAFDPLQATYLMTNLAKDELPVLEFKQTVANMSEPMKEVEARVLTRTLWHDGNPAMTWMMGNVIARMDAKDHIYPRKHTAKDKIDGPVALIMAMARSMVASEEPDVSDFLRNPVHA